MWIPSCSHTLSGLLVPCLLLTWITWSSRLRTTEKKKKFLTQGTWIGKIIGLLFKARFQQGAETPMFFCSCSPYFCGNEVCASVKPGLTGQRWLQVERGSPPTPQQGRKGAKTGALTWQLPLHQVMDNLSMSELFPFKYLARFWEFCRNM